jgi:hypothetical protein
MARGGYRKPTNPAPVSGPGALSRRTDGAQPVMNITGGKYGENKELTELQGSAKMAQSQPSGAPVPGGAPASSKVTPLFSPTERPQEPMTAGMPFGEGPNSPGILTGSIKPTLKDTLLRAMAASDDPDLQIAYHYMQMNGEI